MSNKGDYIEYIKEKVYKDKSFLDELSVQDWINEIGIEIYKLRQKNGYSQKELAEIIGVPQSAISRIESGHNMTCKTIWKLSLALCRNTEVFGVGTLDTQTHNAEYYKVLNVDNKKL